MQALAALNPPAVQNVAKRKPRMRGWPDVVAVLVALPAICALLAHARTGAATLVAQVYGASLLMLFCTSATYHTFSWSPPVHVLLRRLDHTMIYVLIAGTYTPVCVLAVPPAEGTWLLTAVWSVVAFGAIKSFLWIRAPRWVNASVYTLMGWMVVVYMPQVAQGLGMPALWRLIIGGILYMIGAAIYVTRWPNPLPATFGYHEVFHLFVIAAAAWHYYLVWSLVG